MRLALLAGASPLVTKEQRVRFSFLEKLELLELLAKSSPTGPEVALCVAHASESTGTILELLELSVRVRAYWSSASPRQPRGAQRTAMRCAFGAHWRALSPR